MLKTIITHTFCVLAGFALGLIVTYVTTFGLNAKDEKKSQVKTIPLAKKDMVLKKHTTEKLLSESLKKKLKSEPSKIEQNVGSTKHPSEEVKQDSLKKYKKEAIRQKQTSAQAKEQSKPSAKPEVPITATKTLKFKRVSRIKEIKLEVNLGMEEIFVKIEKEMGLGLDTKVTKLLLRGKLLKEGFLDSIQQGATVSVMVRKSTQTAPPSTKPATKSSKTDEGLDFLDSVLDGLKEPPKLVAKQSQSRLPNREKTEGSLAQKSRSKISMSNQKRIQQQLNKDILSMQKVWNRRRHGLSHVYHQGLEFVHATG